LSIDARIQNTADASLPGSGDYLVTIIIESIKVEVAMGIYQR
jgi:hypothetical protein